MNTEYLSCADTAKMIRGELKATFPKIKFGVRSKTYSGGASIDIAWTDGPTGKQVEAITSKFEGKSFDGMIDMPVSNYAYLMPDGSVRWGGTDGTEGSMGVIPADHVPQPINGRRVHFGANYIFCERQYTAGFLASVAHPVCEKFGKPLPVIVDTGAYAYIDRGALTPLDTHSYQTIGDMIYREIQEVAVA